jgi:hypothetical protein
VDLGGSNPAPQTKLNAPRPLLIPCRVTTALNPHNPKTRSFLPALIIGRRAIRGVQPERERPDQLLHHKAYVAFALPADKP